jgi:hypothetical protein
MVLPLTCLADQLLLAIRGRPDSRGPRVGELPITCAPGTTAPCSGPIAPNNSASPSAIAGTPPRPPGGAPHTDHGGRGKLALLSTSHPRGASAASFT